MEYCHDPHCNADHRKPKGCDMCSCWEPRAQKAEEKLRANQEQNVKMVRHLNQALACVPILANLRKSVANVLLAYQLQSKHLPEAIAQCEADIEAAAWVERMIRESP